MAEDMAARWMGDSGILCRSAEEDPRRKELKPVRVKVLGDFSHLYLRNGVGV
jgi:hypothetical protein